MSGMGEPRWSRLRAANGVEAEGSEAPPAASRAGRHSACSWAGPEADVRTAEVARMLRTGRGPRRRPGRFARRPAGAAERGPRRARAGECAKSSGFMMTPGSRLARMAARRRQALAPKSKTMKTAYICELAENHAKPRPRVDRAWAKGAGGLIAASFDRDHVKPPYVGRGLGPTHGMMARSIDEDRHVAQSADQSAPEGHCRRLQSTRWRCRSSSWAMRWRGVVADM